MDDSVDATTDGLGSVAELTLGEIKGLDAGSWFSDSFAGETIPTLDEVFDAFGGAVFVNVEIKSSRDSVDRMERQLAHCVRRHNHARADYRFLFRSSSASADSRNDALGDDGLSLSAGHAGRA